ncbi:MAG TPA: toprim domain-containing protein [bacterium]|nr:toprim domain-containing protein [bacterium]
MLQTEVRQLIEEFRKLPGISLKNAHKLAYSVLNEPALKNVLKNIVSITEKLEICENCGFFRNHSSTCINCSEKNSEICVVATYSDMLAIERTGCFSGSYHILGGLIAPLENCLPEDLLIEQLRNRALKDPGIEILLALPFSIEGDATALYIKDVLDGTDVLLSRIARGLPAGCAPDVLDRRTVLEAFSGKTYIN